MHVLIMVLFSYLIGSVPIGYLLGWLGGIDVRKAGSGNIGATNVARVVGKMQGILTLAGDAAKGFLPVFIAARLELGPGTIAWVAAAAFLGHLYPVFLKFQGGKGVATALGIFLGLAPVVTLLLFAIFVLVVLISRVVSLGSIAAAGSAPVALWLFSYPPFVIALSAFLALMIVLRHRDNIRRLIAGAEPKFQF